MHGRGPPGRTQMGGGEWDVDEKQIIGREVRVSVPSAGGELTKQLGSVVARGCPALAWIVAVGQDQGRPRDRNCV